MTITPEEMRGKAAALKLAAKREGGTSARMDAVWVAEHFLAHAAALDELARLKAENRSLKSSLAVAQFQRQKARNALGALKLLVNEHNSLCGGDDQ